MSSLSQREHKKYKEIIKSKNEQSINEFIKTISSNRIHDRFYRSKVIVIKCNNFVDMCNVLFDYRHRSEIIYYTLSEFRDTIQLYINKNRSDVLEKLESKDYALLIIGYNNKMNHIFLNLKNVIVNK